MHNAPPGVFQGPSCAENPLEGHALTSAQLGNQNIEGRGCLSQLGASLISPWVLSCMDLWLNILLGIASFSSALGEELISLAWLELGVSQAPADDGTEATRLGPGKQKAELSCALANVSVTLLLLTR